MGDPNEKRHGRTAKIRGLEGYRALAVIGIVLYHMCPKIFPGGFLGVNAFFVLMGFLMVYTAGQAGYEKGRVDAKEPGAAYAKSYYLKKIRRLYLPLILMIAATVVITVLFVPSLVRNMASEILSIVFGYDNWYQVSVNSSYFERMQNTSPFTHLWYLGLTIQYYVLWPLVFWAGCRIRHGCGKKGTMIDVLLLGALTVGSALEMAFLYAPQTDPSRIYYGTDTRAFSLLGGMLLGMVPFRRIRHYRGIHKLLMPAGLILAGTMILSWFTMNGADASTYRGGMQIDTVLSVLLLWLILKDQKRLGRIGMVFPLRQIGEISYDIYLVMYPCIYFVQKFTGKDAGAAYVSLTWILIIASALLLHFLSDALLERSSEKGAQKKVVAAMAVVLAGAIGIQSVSSMIRGGGQDMKDLEDRLTDEAYAARRDEQKVLSSMNARALQSVTVNIENQLAAVAESNGSTALAREALSEVQRAPASLRVTMIGDSVMLGSASAITGEIDGCYVDAKVSRQVWDGAQVVHDLEAKGMLADTVIIHLGTNGPGRPENYEDVLDALGKDRKVYWITGYGANIDTDTILANLQAAQEKYPNMQILRWDEAAGGHPEYFVSDGVHLSTEGEEAYASMIREGTGL